MEKVAGQVTQADIDEAMEDPRLVGIYDVLQGHLRRKGHLKIRPFSKVPRRYSHRQESVCVPDTRMFIYISYDIYIQNPDHGLVETLAHELMHVEQDQAAWVWFPQIRVPFFEHDADARAAKHGFELAEPKQHKIEQQLSDGTFEMDNPYDVVMAYLYLERPDRKRLVADAPDSLILRDFMDSPWANLDHRQPWDPKELTPAGKSWRRWTKGVAEAR